MVVLDSVAHCDIIASAAAGRKIKVCMDIDASLRIRPLHVGVRRSPVHSAAEAYALAAEIVKRPELSLTGLMFYAAQIAGLPYNSVAIRAVKHAPLDSERPAPPPSRRRRPANATQRPGRSIATGWRSRLVSARQGWRTLRTIRLTAAAGSPRDEFSQNRPRAEGPQGHLSVKSDLQLPLGGDCENFE
jgi:hypothetical protein